MWYNTINSNLTRRGEKAATLAALIVTSRESALESDAMASGIYVISNIKNSKVYIGQSQNLKRRWAEHKKHLRQGNHKNPHLQSAWNKYGEKFFRFRVLEHCSIDNLNEREQHYLDIYMPKGVCYNIASDAYVASRGLVRSFETRQKLSESHKGKSPSAEQRKKLSEATKGTTRKPFTDEHRRRLSQSHIGKTPSLETRERMSKSRIGKVFSKETGDKISAAKMGHTVTEETRRRMSEAAKHRHMREKTESENEQD